MNSSNRSDRSESSNANNSNACNSNTNTNNTNTKLGINFELPSLQLDLSSISQAFKSTNFNIASNLEELMSFTKFNTRSKDVCCDSCGNKFTFLKRKRTCMDCGMDFCNGCLIKDNVSDRRNHCKRCRVFNSVPLDRNALLGLRARDLKWFLASRRISSQMCNEKGELVDLIIQSLSPQSNTSNNSNASEYVRRFDNYSTSYSRAPQQTDQNESVSSNHSPTNTTHTNDNTVTSNTSQINSQNNSPSHSERSQNTNVTEAKSDSNTEQMSTNARFNIDDLKSVEELKELSVRQLKLVLARNFIDYKGCVEKEELLTKALRLWNDRQEIKNQNIDEIQDSNVCKICMESTIDCVLLECGHMLTCTDCGKRLSECPICRQYVIRVVHIFKA